MEIKFTNLIDSETGETVKVKVPDEFDTGSIKEWGRLGREAGERRRKAFASPGGEMLLNLSQEDLDNAFAEDVDEHYWELI